MSTEIKKPKYSFMEEGKTQVCQNPECMFYNASQEVQVTIKATGEKKKIFLDKCQICSGKLIIDDLEKYED